MRLIKVPKIAFLLAAGGMALAAGSGCALSPPREADQDSQFIRVPGEAGAGKVGAAVRARDLLPASTSARWQYRVTTVNLRSEGESGDDPALPPPSGETATASPFAGGGVAYALVRSGQRAPYRTERYRGDSTGLLLLGVEGASPMQLSPAQPLLRFPLKEGAVAAWQGTIRFQKQTLPARGFCRVGGSETVTTPAGTFRALRSDSLLIATVNGRQVSFPIVRWFAPGVGIVRQRALAGNLAVVKDLVAYRGVKQPPV